MSAEGTSSSSSSAVAPATSIPITMSEEGTSSSSSSAVAPATSIPIPMSEDGTSSSSSSAVAPATSMTPSMRERARKTSAVKWFTYCDDAAALTRLLEEDRSLANAADYDTRTPLHAAAINGLVDVAKILIDFGAQINPRDRWNNTPLADAHGAQKHEMIEFLISHGGETYGQDGSHFKTKNVPLPISTRGYWEVDPSELDFYRSSLIGKGSFGEIIKAYWRGTPVAVKRILPSLSDDNAVVQDFKNEVNLLIKLRHPNVVQFLGAVTESNPMMMITEYLRGGDLYDYLERKGALNPATAIQFALHIASGMAYLHNGKKVLIHRDLKPRNILLENTNADVIKVADFGLSKLLTAEKAHDVYKMTGETGSYRYMAPEVFKHRKYDKKVDVYSFGMILYQMVEGRLPFSNIVAYAAAESAAEGKRPQFRGGIVPELRELIEQCWAADANQRPCFLEIITSLNKVQGALPNRES